MRSKWILIAFACACGGSPTPNAPEPVATVTLPTVTPPPPPPPRPPSAEHQRADVTITVSFAEVRKHPNASRVDTVIRAAPAWRAFASIDPVRDLDWLVQHGDDMVVEHAISDARVDAAIAQVAQPVSVGTAGVKAWRGTVNNLDAVFLRAQPQVVRVARAEDLDGAARELVAHPPAAPSFHANEALRMRMLWPALIISAVPQDISEARVWIDSRIADSGADIYAEAECPDADAARTDAAALVALIQHKNTFGVRLITAGLLNNVEVTTNDKQVHLHLRATQQQIDAVMTLASSNYGVIQP